MSRVPPAIPSPPDPALLARFAEGLGQLAINLTVAALVAVVTLWASGLLGRMTHRALERWPRTRHDATLQGFAAYTVRIVVLGLGLLTVLTRLGVQTASILAVLGAASLAVGLALQGTLSNVAAGVMLLLLRPYRVGDYVETAGRSGTVRSLDLFHTELTDDNGLRVIVPNSRAFGDVIVNVSGAPGRRIELGFPVAYEDDPARAAALLRSLAEGEPKVLRDPPPWADVTAQTDTAATVTLRAWTAPADYVDLRSDLLRRGRAALADADFRVPYPRQITLAPAEDRPAGSGTPEDHRP